MKLIAGIDPGTTVGWAVLDLQGKVVAADSQKELDLDSLVAKLVRVGKVILIGSDKAKIPSFVEEIATKLGAKVIGPWQDLRVEEKRQMVSKHEFKNAHEMDALASAHVALRKVNPLLTKIHSFLEREKQLSMFEDVFELVLKEEISIRAAITLLTPKIEIREEKIEVQKPDKDIVQLYGALSRTRKDNAVLLQKVREIDKQLQSAEQKLSALKERTAGLVKPKSPAQVAEIKERQIKSLSDRLENALQTQEWMKSQLEHLESALLKEDTIALPRLRHLGWDEVMQNKEFVNEGSVLFVHDPNQMSENAVEWLLERGVQLVVCSKLPGSNARSLLPFACVQAPECEQLKRVVLVKKSWLDKVRANRLVLAKIMEEYKKARSTV